MEAKFAALKTIEDISILKGTSFEEFLGAVFEDLGYAVDLTPFSGDYGADLILISGEQKIVVQAKQYAKPVGFNAVKEVHFARTYYSATDAWVIATHGFTQQAIDAAKASDIRLIDGGELLSFVVKANTEGLPSGKAASFSIDAELLRASTLVVKNGNTLPGFLEKEMEVSFERALKLLGKMEKLGIVAASTAGREVVVSDEEYIKLVDSYYDPKTSRPRFESDGHPFEMFRTGDPDAITVVEDPATYPSFYAFERDLTQPYECNWVCVGINQPADINNSSDIAERRNRLSSLKLYDVLNCVNEGASVDYYVDGEVRSCAYLLRNVRVGKAEVHSPGYAKREAEMQAEMQRRKEEVLNREERRRIADEQSRNDVDGAMGCACLIFSAFVFFIILSSCSAAFR